MHVLALRTWGHLSIFWGSKCACRPQEIFLCQWEYILDIINECGLLGAKQTEFPIKENHKLTQATRRLLDDATRYRRLVRCLIYLTITRPELVYVVHTLSQFM